MSVSRLPRHKRHWACIIITFKVIQWSSVWVWRRKLSLNMPATGCYIIKTLPYLCSCSPDAIIAQERTQSACWSENECYAPRSFIVSRPSSVQHADNQLCRVCGFVLYDTLSSGNINYRTWVLNSITGFRIYADQCWRHEFLLINAALFYDTYLKWAYCTPPDVSEGQGVVEVLTDINTSDIDCGPKSRDMCIK